MAVPYRLSTFRRYTRAIFLLLLSLFLLYIYIYINILALGRRIFPAFPFHAEEAFRFSSPEEKALVLWDNCENSWWRGRGRERERLDRRGDRDKHSDPDSR